VSCVNKINTLQTAHCEVAFSQSSITINTVRGPKHPGFDHTDLGDPDVGHF